MSTKKEIIPTCVVCRSYPVCKFYTQIKAFLGSVGIVTVNERAEINSLFAVREYRLVAEFCRFYGLIENAEKPWDQLSPEEQGEREEKAEQNQEIISSAPQLQEQQNTANKATTKSRPKPQPISTRDAIKALGIYLAGFLQVTPTSTGSLWSLNKLLKKNSDFEKINKFMASKGYEYTEAPAGKNKKKGQRGYWR